MKYKLICIDMDGTLLNKNHDVSKENKIAIKKAIEKGVCVAVTTGRLFASAKYFANLIGAETPIISSNGAYISEKNGNKVIYKSTLTLDQILRIYDIIKKYELTVYFNMSDAILADKKLPSNHGYKLMNDLIEKEEDRIKIYEDIDLIKTLEKYKRHILKAICVEEKDLEKLYKVKEELKKYSDLEVVSSWKNNFEIMKAGTSKGKAVEMLAKFLDIKKEEVICIGDSENDLSMIKYAGLGVAMGNGMNLIKQECDYITFTNEENGVARVIEKFVL